MDETGIITDLQHWKIGFLLFFVLIMLFVSPFKGAVRQRYKCVVAPKA